MPHHGIHNLCIQVISHYTKERTIHTIQIHIHTSNILSINEQGSQQKDLHHRVHHIKSFFDQPPFIHSNVTIGQLNNLSHLHYSKHISNEVST